MALRSTLILLLALLPAASALEITGTDEARMISASAPTTLSYDVTIDCQDFVTGTTTSYDVSLSSDLPAYYGASSSPVTFAAGPDCITGTGTLTQTVDLTLTPTADALGLAPTPFKVTASDGTSEATFDNTENIQIEYVDGHTIATDVSFPFEFTGDALHLNLTVDITANSQTMVMFLDVTTEGSLEGLFHQIFDVEGNETTRTLPLTWMPPAGDWTNATIAFYNYSHCLKGTDCGETNEANVVWQINNMQTSGNGDGDNEDSPGLPLVGLLAALGVVALRRR